MRTFHLVGFVAQVPSYHAPESHSFFQCNNSLHAEVLDFIHLWPWKCLESLIPIIINYFFSLADNIICMEQLEIP